MRGYVTFKIHVSKNEGKKPNSYKHLRIMTAKSTSNCQTEQVNVYIVFVSLRFYFFFVFSYRKRIIFHSFATINRRSLKSCCKWNLKRNEMLYRLCKVNYVSNHVQCWINEACFLQCCVSVLPWHYQPYSSTPWTLNINRS